jgi:hypothetical protein
MVSESNGHGVGELRSRCQRASVMVVESDGYSVRE